MRTRVNGLSQGHPATPSKEGLRTVKEKTEKALLDAKIAYYASAYMTAEGKASLDKEVANLQSLRTISIAIACVTFIAGFAAISACAFCILGIIPVVAAPVAFPAAIAFGLLAGGLFTSFGFAVAQSKDLEKEIHIRKQAIAKATQVKAVPVHSLAGLGDGEGIELAVSKDSTAKVVKPACGPAGGGVDGIGAGSSSPLSSDDVLSTTAT